MKFRHIIIATLWTSWRWKFVKKLHDCRGFGSGNRYFKKLNLIGNVFRWVFRVPRSFEYQWTSTRKELSNNLEPSILWVTSQRQFMFRNIKNKSRIIYYPLKRQHFGLNIGKYGPEITPYMDTFHKMQGFSRLVTPQFWVILKYLDWPRRFYFTRDMTNLYLFIQDLSEWPFSELFFFDVSL